MPKGDNKTVINFTTELKQFADSNKGDLERSFHVALTYLAHYKEEFIAKYGQECYDAHVKRYSIPAIELRNNSVQRKKESLALKRRELELREKELELKTKFLNAETQVMSDRHEQNSHEKEHRNRKIIARLENELIPINGSLKSAEEALLLHPDNKGHLEPRIAQFKEKKAELEAQIAQLR